MTELEEALAYLEVTADALAQAPRVSHLFRHVNGGSIAVWEALYASDSAEARKLVAARARLTERQFAAVPFEAIALAAGLTTKRAFGAASEALVEVSQETSRLLLHASTPAVLQASIDRAKEQGGHPDRKMLLQSVGLVARPKNSFTVVNGDVVKGNKAQVAVVQATEVFQRRMATRFQTEMEIPALPPAPEYVEDTEEEEILDAEFMD